MTEAEHIIKCSKCLQHKSTSDFFIRKSGPRVGKIQQPCRTCKNEKCRLWISSQPQVCRNKLKKSSVASHKKLRKKKKLKVIDCLGGSCQDCGGHFHSSVYDLHHINPDEKDSRFSQLLSLSWDKIEVELCKCVLLCANCHRLRHYGNEE